MTMMYFRPAVGDAFAVTGRRDHLRVAQLIASFAAEGRDDSMYLVEAPAGSRWIIAENPEDDGPRWIGRPVPAETKTL